MVEGGGLVVKIKEVSLIAEIHNNKVLTLLENKKKEEIKICIKNCINYCHTSMQHSD